MNAVSFAYDASSAVKEDSEAEKRKDDERKATSSCHKDHQFDKCLQKYESYIAEA